MAKILPTYRLAMPAVCAPTSKVEPAEVNANRFALVQGGSMMLDTA
jgi:hypothetical protein